MTNDPKAGKGLDPELLAAYIDNRLPPEQRAVVEEQLANDPDSYSVMVETLKAIDDGTVPHAHKVPDVRTVLEVPRDSVSRVPRVRRWAIAGGVLAAAAAVVLVVRLQPELLNRIVGRDSVDPRFERLTAAVGEERYIEARLSGGFKYGPLRPVTRSAQELSQQNLALLAVAGELQKSAQADPSAANLHAWGVAQLLLKDVDGAVDTLEAVTLAEPSFGAGFADLAAAYLTRFQTQARAEDLPRAVEAAERARHLQSDQIESLYTRAIALELMNLREMAVSAWQEYLERDGSSPWAAEARRRLAALNKSDSKGRWEGLRDGIVSPSSPGTLAADVVREFPDELPDLLLGTVLPAWARAIDRSDSSGADWVLARARALTTALSDAGGDRTFAGLLPGLASAPRSALAALGEGIVHLDHDRYLAAEPSLEHALDGFGGQPVLAQWTAFHLARSRLYAGQLPTALALLDRADAGRIDTAHPQLAARATWIRGIIFFTQGRYRDAREDYEKAVALFARAAEPRGGATALMNLSVLYRFLGDRERSWAHRIQGLSLMPRHRPSRYYGFLTSTAITASLDGMPRVALRVMDEAVLTANTLAPNVQAESRLQRGRLLARAGSLTPAVTDLEMAARLVVSIGDEASRSRTEDSLRTAEAEVYQQLDPARSAEMARAAAASFDARGDHLRSAELALYGGRALANGGSEIDALATVATGIAAFNRARDSISASDPVRISALEPVWGLFDEDFALRVRDAAFDRPAAFAAFEASRARTVIESVRGDRLSWARVREVLDAQTALVLLHQREHELLVWHITSKADRLFRLPWTKDESARLVALARRELRSGGTSGTGVKLRSSLLEPLAASVPMGATLVIVPDGAFHQVPWSGLRDEAGQPVVKKWAVSVAPSVSLALRPVSRRRNLSALIVGVAEAEGQPALPAVRSEARAIARLYADAELLLDAQATPSALLTRLAGHSVVHISAHAVDSPTYPLLSRLMLSGNETSGSLNVSRIVDEADADGALVTLAACGSIGRGHVRGEGTVGLAWAFLMARASSVIGSLWELDDATSTPLFVALHTNINHGMAPAHALRAAQLNARDQGLPDAEWAALQVIGHP